MYKIAAIGDKDSVLAFKAVGVDVYTETAAIDVRRKIDELAKKDYAIIFITEELSILVEETIQRYKNEVLPAIVLIPSNKGTLNIGLDNINKNVEKAVGSNIL